MVGEISEESTAALLDLGDDLHRFFLIGGAWCFGRAFGVRRVGGSCARCAVVAVGWMAIVPPLLFGVIAPFSPSL